MKTTFSPCLVPLAAALGTALWLAAATPQVTEFVREANGELLLTATADPGAFYRIDTSADLEEWTPFVTVLSTGTEQLLDTATPGLDQRYYRATPLPGSGHITGDHLPTENGDAVLHPIGHASVLVSWNDKAFYSDPSDLNGNGPKFTGLPLADVIVITHTHGDHFATGRLNLLVKADTVIFAPQAVFSGMPAGNVPGQAFTLRSRTAILANGAADSAHGMTVGAVAMYNPSGSPHSQGVGNGYVVTLGGKRIYFSGDSEDVPEMRALTDIDAAFVCMSLPSNMTVDAAASAVREFRPRLVFPYHYRQATTFDVARFKELVGTDLGIEVRQREFY
jgi:L-ascorbate metabolism protein UlaG (beta-lactamase superfamily)